MAFFMSAVNWSILSGAWANRSKIGPKTFWPAPSGSMPKINQTTLKSLPLPIPPLAEQSRIVAKVDQLMALVDQLEDQLSATRATAANLLAALVAELTTQV